MGGGWTKTKLMLFSTQVEDFVEVGVELGKNLDQKNLVKKFRSKHILVKRNFGPKDFWSKKGFVKKKFDPKNLGPKNCWLKISLV